MKRVAFILMFLFTAGMMYAVNIEKRYKHLIENLDVTEEAKAVAADSAAVFWRTAIDSNRQYSKFVKAMKKKRGAEKEALEKVANLPRLYTQYDETIVEGMQGFCDSLLIDMGIPDLGINCSLHIVDSEDPYPFTALTEDGFAMCITTALAAKKGITYDILMSYVANEFVHGAMQHHLRLYYTKAKDRRQSAVAEALAAGVVVAAGALLADNSAPSDKQEHKDRPAPPPVANVNIDVNVPTPRYLFDYLREQVFEADLFAYRFLERMGKGEQLLNALRILGSSYDELFSANKYHPTVENRIDFLKYVKQHPELGNTKSVTPTRDNYSGR